MAFGCLFKSAKVHAIRRIQVIPAWTSKRNKSLKPRTFFKQQERKEEKTDTKQYRSPVLAQVIAWFEAMVTWLSSGFRTVRLGRVFFSRRKNFKTKLQKINLEPSPKFERKKPYWPSLALEDLRDEIQLPFESEARSRTLLSAGYPLPMRANGSDAVELRTLTAITAVEQPPPFEDTRIVPEENPSFSNRSLTTLDENSVAIPRLKLELLEDFSPVQSPKRNFENEDEDKGWTPSWFGSSGDWFPLQISPPEATYTRTPSPRPVDSPNEGTILTQQTAKVEMASATTLANVTEITKKEHKANEVMARKLVIELICRTFGVVETKDIEELHFERLDRKISPESILRRKLVRRKPEDKKRVLFNECRNDYKYYVVGDAPKEMYWGASSPMLVLSPEYEPDFEPEFDPEFELEPDFEPVPAAKPRFQLYSDDELLQEEIEDCPPRNLTKPFGRASSLPDIFEDYDELEENVFKGFGCYDLFKKF